MRLYAFTLIAVFVLAEGLALLAGPCCINGMLGLGENPGETCPHHAEARPGNCCVSPEPERNEGSCCQGGSGEGAALERAPDSCNCSFEGIPRADKSLTPGGGEWALQVSTTLSSIPDDIPESFEDSRPEIRESTGPPRIPFSILNAALLL